MIVYLDDLRFRAEDIVFGEIENQPTGNKLRTAEFKVSIYEKEIFDQLSEILSQKKIDVKFMDGDQQIELKAGKPKYSYSYQSTSGQQDTEYSVTVKIEELDPDLPLDHDFDVAKVRQITTNWIRTRAIVSLLIKKGIITEQEYLDEFDAFIERDFLDLVYHILYGLELTKKDLSIDEDKKNTPPE